MAGLASAEEIQGQKAMSSGASALAKGIDVSQSQRDKAGSQAKNWLNTDGNYAQTRFYPGKQINTGNVKRLLPKFTFQTEVLKSMETAPIVVDGVMFMTTSYNHVYALGAVNGKSVLALQAQPDSRHREPALRKYTRHCSDLALKLR